MTDVHALPEGHVLKPLENRLLEMCDDTHPAMRVLMGNAVAALRVFAEEHEGLTELYYCPECDSFWYAAGFDAHCGEPDRLCIVCEEDS